MKIWCHLRIKGDIEVKKQLTEQELVIEEWGGKTIAVPVSAKKKIGLDDLLEMILLVADLAELKAEFNQPAIGTIIESRLDKGKGPTATVLIQRGSLHIGDIVVIGSVYGKVRDMHDYKGKKVKVANPSDPAEIIGLAEVPKAGDILQAIPDEKKAKAIADRRKQQVRTNSLETKKTISLENLAQQLKEGELDQLNLIIKADTKGSLEAIKSSLEKIDQTEVRINIIHEGIGDINHSDVSLAAASSGVLIGFNVKVPPLVDKSAKLLGLEISIFDIIYNLLDNIQQAITGIIKAKPKEVFIGKFKVKAIFATFPNSVIIGGEVIDGFLTNHAHGKILRNNEQVASNAKIQILKRVNEEVTKVDKGLECGIQLNTKFRKIKSDDIIEFFEWEGTKPN